METVREHAFSPWRDLDVLVAAEFDALESGRARRRPPTGPDPFDAPEEPLPADDELLSEPDDEESFIERTAAWLKGRADADALLEAVRAALAEPAPGPDERPADAQHAPEPEPPPAAEAQGEAPG